MKTITTEDPSFESSQESISSPQAWALIKPLLEKILDGCQANKADFREDEEEVVSISSMGADGVRLTMNGVFVCELPQRETRFRSAEVTLLTL
jgi:hypothetical protein